MTIGLKMFIMKHQMLRRERCEICVRFWIRLRTEE